MSEVSGPIIAISLVLMCVFVPCAFITGITGQFFRQFALTIAVSTFFSAVNSLTLSPALCALLLKPKDQQRDPLSRVLNLVLGWFFKLFNLGFKTTANIYARGVGIAVARQRDRAGGLWRAVVPHLFWLHAGADRIHSLARQGIFAGRRAAARLGVAWSARKK